MGAVVSGSRMPPSFPRWPKWTWTPTLLIVLSLAGARCGGTSPPPSSRPVLTGPEDEDDDEVSCSVLRRFDIEEQASLASPALTRSPRGVAVAWIRRHHRQHVIRLLELSTELEPLGEVLDIDPGDGMPLDVHIASCSQRVDIVWELQHSEGYSIRLASQPSGATLPGGALSVATASLGMDPSISCVDETTLIAWSTRVSGVQDVFVRWFGGQDALGAPFRVSGESDAAETPAVACADARCAVVWSDRRAVYAEIYATIVDVGSEDALTPVRVSEHDQTISGAGGAYEPDVTALGDGGFMVTWRDNRSRDETEIYASSLSPRGRVGADRRISWSQAPSTGAEAASCVQGSALIAWRDRRQGPSAVMIAAVDARGRRRSAATRITGEVDEVSTPAAVCGRGRDHILTWTEATPSSVDGALAMALVRCQ